MKKNLIKEPERVIQGIQSGLSRRKNKEETEAKVILRAEHQTLEYSEEEFMSSKSNDILNSFTDDTNIEYIVIIDDEPTNNTGFIRKYQEQEQEQTKDNFSGIAQILQTQQNQTREMLGLLKSSNPNHSDITNYYKTETEKLEKQIEKLETKIEKLETEKRETERFYQQRIDTLRDQIQSLSIQTAGANNTQTRLEILQNELEEYREENDELKIKLREYELEKKYKRNQEQEPSPFQQILFEKGIQLVDKLTESPEVLNTKIIKKEIKI